MARPRITENGKHPKRYVRIAVDYSHKRQVLDRTTAGTTVSDVLDEFFPSLSKTERKRKQKQISKWKTQASFIQKMCADGKDHLQNFRRNGDATVLSREAVENIVMWLNSMSEEGCPVSAKMLELKALEEAADDGISQHEFTAS
ncbi:hypothetical protein P3T76_006620 [Phytophthora citrophthora]|uniref:HTH CENPB-type domain-containing protein n=1 Tax=Phytophthora citrophthora TaxID=4793 RepID=A0AAD9GQ90_9STRA|nr:hypothetical protein P3T76_006620 [Phytophthora citrophthora]